MADVVFTDGREVTLDLSKITREEYRTLFDPKQDRVKESEIIARVSGLTFDEVDGGLSMLDWKRLAAAFFKKCREPLADPN